jgi:hypothetical protein
VGALAASAHRRTHRRRPPERIGPKSAAMTRVV